MSPHPLVDQDSKNELIIKKQIRQSTSKILQRPSQFSGYDNKPRQLETNARIKEKLEHALGHKQPPIAQRRAKQDSVTGFDKTFQSNFKEDKRLTEYEEQFAALHHESEYECVDNKNNSESTNKPNCFKPVSMGNTTRGYLEPKHLAKTQSHSSNSARDILAKKAQTETICLGKEPDVNQSQNLRLMQRLTNTIDRKLRQLTPALPDLEVVKRTNGAANTSSNFQIQQKLKSDTKVPQRIRKCPDPTLYEDIIESSTDNNDNPKHLNDEGHRRSTTGGKSSSPEPNPDIRTPFENAQNCLFSMFTAVVPWCLMKKVYWKRDRRSEELYERTTRLNAKSRKMSENNSGCSPVV